MSASDPTDPRARGASIRGARLARVRTIRRRVVGGAVALFAALWLLIAVTLISGHDPALAKRSSSSSANGSGSTGGSGTSATLTSTGSTSSGSASVSSSGSSGSGLSSVTTSQS